MALLADFFFFTDSALLAWLVIESQCHLCVYLSQKLSIKAIQREFFFLLENILVLFDTRDSKSKRIS